MHLLAVVILTGIAGDLFVARIHLAGGLTWLALCSTLAAVLLCFWDPEANYWGLPVSTTYVTGLLCLGLLLHGLALSPRELARTNSLLLSVYLAAAASIAWLLRAGDGCGVGCTSQSGWTPAGLPGLSSISALLGLLDPWL